jgi:ubiquinone biosynthesis protein
MLTAEGTGRKLNPEANMWMMSKPLIEDWMIYNLGPEARMIEASSDIAQALRRLPRLLENLDKGAQELAEGRLSLHPETIRALKGESRFDFVFLLLMAAGVTCVWWLATFLS